MLSPTSIAFDARPLLGSWTGVGWWLAGLLRELAARTEWRFVLAVPRPVGNLQLDGLDGRAVILAPPVPLPGTLWLQTLAGPAASMRSSAYVGSLGILPRRLTVPAALAVHDLTPISRPQHHTLANRFCFSAYFGESLECADELVCASSATRERLRAFDARHGARAQVIPLAADPFFSPPPAGETGDAVRRQLAGGRPFVVQLGTLEPRKGIPVLLQAHARLLTAVPSAPDLVLAGGGGWGGRWLARALEAHPHAERVHLPGYVSRETARALLRHAEAVVLASEEEGFGLPLAEALACGAPCVISDEAALLEVAGECAQVFRRGDASGLAEALVRTLGGERTRLREASLARARQLAWDGPATAWVSLLTALLA
ncbi:MAG: glycosyltransferase family 4 protein [Thermoanaerobaculaceae bacterium]|nr:glycosyltransferase family 4 protein [Thermoanaerobaculaceae bacterium]MDI9621055.1 glycosyltransferase family 1 protein [Acidobacteriota bacterium]NLH12512.1 glycosyltransferase family 4 protein [Holophagae bacterium]HPW56533.1 glycosyltransferase family 1 protein [Thermoanaerobaculaceae bacterium]